MDKCLAASFTSVILDLVEIIGKKQLSVIITTAVDHAI